MAKNVEAAEQKSGIVRRDFLKLSGGTVATMVLAACTRSGSNLQATPSAVGVQAAATNVTPASGAQYISVKTYGAAGDGITDDTTAIQNANNAATSQNLPLYFPAGTYAVSKTLQQTASWEGEYGGPVNNSDNPAKLMKTNGNTNGSAVVQVGAANISCRFISCVVPNPPNYDMASYPTTAAFANNPSYGFYAPTDTVCQSLLIYGCSASGFSATGIYLGLGEVVCQIQACDVRWCATGIIVASTDCQVVACNIHHNCGQGLSVTATYGRMINNTLSWNAQEGMYVSGGEFVVNNNVFDRNGKAGLFIDSGWGGTVCSNSFSRNGASGNGSLGRWGFSTPGTESYALIAATDSCHIKVFYQRDVAITGNTYVAGLGDSNDGALSPAYVYNNAGANGNIAVGGNTGESAYLPSTGTGGYNTSYPGGSGVYYGGTF